MVNQEKNIYIQKAMLYDFYSQINKYKNPNLHIKYYKKHLQYLNLSKNASSNKSVMNPIVHSRIINLLPYEVDIRINKKDILKNLPPYGVSEYFLTPSTVQQLEVMVPESPGSIISTSLELRGCTFTSLIINENNGAKKIDSIPTDPYLPDDETKLRFIHYSQTHPSVDVRVKHGDTVFSNLSFGESTDYLGLTPMSVELKLIDSKSKKTLHPFLTYQLQKNEIYSAFLVEDKTSNNGLKILLLKD
jgi:hypothetical protein